MRPALLAKNFKPNLLRHAKIGIAARPYSHSHQQEAPKSTFVRNFFLLGLASAGAYYAAKQSNSDLLLQPVSGALAEASDKCLTTLVKKHIEGSDPALKVIFQLYDSTHPLQKQFPSKAVEAPGVTFVRIDVSDPKVNKGLLGQLLEASEVSLEKIKRKAKPTFLLRADDRFSKLKPEFFLDAVPSTSSKTLSMALQKEGQIVGGDSSTTVSCVKDLAESLRVFNVDIDDCTFVHCNLKGAEMNKENQNVYRLIKSQSRNPILSVNDAAVAKTLGMEDGKYYCYYKPSYINGFGQYFGQQIDFPYLQALEGVARDEFEPLHDNIQAVLDRKSVYGLLPESVSQQLFDEAFKRSYNVEFTFNTDFAEFKRKYKNPSADQKPLLVIIWPEMFMSQYINDFSSVTKEYSDAFDIFYLRDKEQAKEFFNVKVMPGEMPHLYIVDTQSKRMVKAFADTLSGVTSEQTERKETVSSLSGQQMFDFSEEGNQSGEETSEQRVEKLRKPTDFYYKKYQGFVFNIQSPKKELKDFIEKFLDDQLNHHYVTSDRVQDSRLKFVNADTFEKEILNNDKVKQCVIEVIKEHCPACFVSKFNTNMISRKMEKHGLLEKLPFFRMKISNQIPYLGEFPHTPLHLYVRKEGKRIVEIKMLDSPLPQAKTDKFLEQLQEKSGISNLTDKIKIDVAAHRTNYFNYLTLAKDYDIDFDTKEGYLTVTERNRLEKEKLEKEKAAAAE